MKSDWTGVVDSTVARLYAASFAAALGFASFGIAVPYYVLDRIGKTDAVGDLR